MKSFAANKDELSKRVSSYLKERIKRQGLTYSDLARLLKRHGFPDETTDSLKQKMTRGTFSAAFFLAAAAALGESEVRLRDV